MNNKKGKEVQVRKSEKKWPDWNEKIYNRPHTLTPRIKKFIYHYVRTMGKYTLEEFAVKFHVDPSTITLWLAYPETKDEINRLMEDYKERALSGIEIHLDDVVKGLFKIFKDPRTNAETKRKLGRDFLSFGGIVDVNVGRQIVVQQQATVVGQVNFDNMTDDELRQELAELKELREA